jgi:hypothetical protein
VSLFVYSRDGEGVGTMAIYALPDRGYTPPTPAIEPVDQRPNLAVIPGEGQQTPESLNLLEQYFVSRELADRFPGAEGEELAAIRADVADWLTRTYPGIHEPGTIEDYTNPARTLQESKIGALAEYLRHNHAHEGGVSWAELLATEDFLKATMALHADKDAGIDLSRGQDSHAFVVPVRLSRDHPEYSDEIRPLVHALRYVPDELVPWFMSDQLPFVFDRYKDGGYPICAPITADMQRDLATHSATAPIKAGRARVNEAVELGYALGAREFGYGATLPGLMHYGKATARENVITTTGHGGTTALMCMLIEQVGSQVPAERGLRIGSLGLGTIGLAATQVIADMYPQSEVHVSEPDQDKVRKLVSAEPERYTVHPNAKGVIESCDIIISTATTTFNLADAAADNHVAVESMEGKVVLDDSQPHSFIPEEVVALGGVVAEVIGRDWSGGLQRLSEFGYGGTLQNRKLDAFGCELEVATLARLRKDLLREGKSPQEVAAVLGGYALRGPVTPHYTRKWIDLFRQYGIGPAPLQAFGKSVELAPAV